MGTPIEYHSRARISPGGFDHKRDSHDIFNLVIYLEIIYLIATYNNSLWNQYVVFQHDLVKLAFVCYQTGNIGIIYYRGDLFDVIDVGRLLGTKKSLPNGNPYVILLKWDQRKLGLIPDRIVGMEWIEDPDRTQIVITKDGRTIQMITPEEVWKILSELPYGH